MTAWTVTSADRLGQLVLARARTPVSWTRIAGDLLVWSADTEAVRAHAGAATRESSGLTLVTQVGRAFQHEYPEVRVLLDHGRHLVVEGALPTESDLCWRAEPMPADTVVVDNPVPVPREADPDLAALLGLLSQPSYEALVTSLATRHTRHSLTSGFTDAADWAADILRGVGYTVSRPAITVGSGRSENVIADRPGSGDADREVVIVTAHLDSINLAGGQAARAPGADDNASGSAGVVELGRVLVTRTWHHDLRLILFGGEEEGLHGSAQYVASLPATERARIRAVINMDMVGRQNTESPAVLLEGAGVSVDLVSELAAAAATWTDLAVSTSLSPFASDHVPFINAGIPAVLTIEGNDSANDDVHTDRDVLATLDFALTMQILRMNLATSAIALSVEAMAPHPAGSVVF